ncbi:hypothetical protein JTB14_009541 [Gonioctena quinquepunctata]|nr:hypothetical protein JTB14_009541 [Gonioctena quinquepunctata]
MESHSEPLEPKPPDKKVSPERKSRVKVREIPRPIKRSNTKPPADSYVRDTIYSIQSVPKSTASSSRESSSSVETRKRPNTRTQNSKIPIVKDTYSSASESDNPRSSFTSEDNTTKVEKRETDDESGKPQTIPSANIADKTAKQPSESSLEKSPPMKKSKQSDKEADKEIGKIISILPAHALIAIVPPGPPADSTPASGDIETTLPPPRSDEKKDATSLPPPEIDNEQIEDTLPPPEASYSQETAQTDISIEEREPTDARTTVRSPHLKVTK